MRLRPVALALTLLAAATPAVAQRAHTTNTPTFRMGETLLGPTIGLGGLGGANLSIGGRFEHAIKPLPDFGNGTLGIGVNLDYYSYTYKGPGYDWSYRYIPVSVTANYHFAMSPEYQKFDPFFGLGLGYSVASVSGGGTATSDLYFVGTLGGRYFFNPRTALQAEIGTGVATLNLGVMFRM